MKEQGNSEPPRGYVRALRYRILTRLYDPVMRRAMPEEELRRRLAEQAAVEPGHAILDLGCGTGSLTLRIRQAYPSAAVAGLDGDPAVLALARKKAAAAGASIDYHLGLASDPPFDDGIFDRIVSCLMFHHLATVDKERALARCRRLLRRGGQIHIADWGHPANQVMRFAFLAVRLLDGFGPTSDSAHGRLPGLLTAAGFRNVREGDPLLTAFGTLRFFSGDA